jgi:hypothetical protein
LATRADISRENRIEESPPGPRVPTTSVADTDDE